MSGFCWVSSHSGLVPPGAVQAGVDKDGGMLFVGRSYFGSDIIPTKIVPNQGCGFVSFDGREHKVTGYEVLCHGNPAWMCASNGEVPHNALLAGRTAEGEGLYIGRVMHDGTFTPGKIHPSHGVCYIPYDGEEIPFKEYEVLIVQ